MSNVKKGNNWNVIHLLDSHHHFIMCTFWSNFPLHNKDPNRPASNEGIFQPYPSRASQTDGAFFYVLHNSTNYKVNENYKSIKRRDWVYINSVFRRIEYQFTSKQDWNQTTISSWKRWVISTEKNYVCINRKH